MSTRRKRGRVASVFEAVIEFIVAVVTLGRD